MFDSRVLYAALYRNKLLVAAIYSHVMDVSEYRDERIEEGGKGKGEEGERKKRGV